MTGSRGCWLFSEYAEQEWIVHVENTRRRQRPMWMLFPTFVHVRPDGEIVVNQIHSFQMRAGRRGEKLTGKWAEDRYMTVQEANA